MYDKKVVVKAVCAVSVVVVGFVCLYATLSDKTAASRNRNSSMKEKKRGARTLQNGDDLLFPDQICPENERPFDQPMSTVDGLCSYLSNTNGCCSATRFPTLRRIEPAAPCTTACLTQLQSFWCFLSCTDQINNAAAQPLCEGQVEAMFNSCNGCTTFGTYTDFADYRADLVTRIGVTTQTPCTAFFDVNTRLATETAAPLIRANEALIQPGDIDFVGGNPTSATNVGTILVDQSGSNLATNTPPPSYMEVTYRTPAPNRDFANLATITSFDFSPDQPGIFSATHSITLGAKAVAGVWTLFVTEVANTNGTQREIQVGEFTVANDFDPTANGWGDVSLCAGANTNNIGAPILRLQATQSAGAIDCCDPAGCTIACSDNSVTGENAVAGISSTTSTIPLTIRDCRLVSASVTTPIPAGQLIRLPSTTTLFSTNIIFTSAGKRVEVGQAGATSTISSADASTMTFNSGATLAQVGDNSIVDSSIDISFDSQSSMTLENAGQEFRITGGGELSTENLITMVLAGQSFTVSPTPNNQRNHLLINGQSARLNGNNQNALNILAGRVEVQDGQIQANVFIGPTGTAKKMQTLARTSKFATQQSNPQDFVAEICCRATCGNDVTIRENGALFIIPPANSNLQACIIDPNATPVVSARIGGNLVSNSNSRIVVTGAALNGSRLQIAGSWTTGQNVIFEVTLSTANVVTSNFTIQLAEWSAAAGPCTNVNVNVVLTNGDPTRPFTQSCATVNGVNVLSIEIPAVRATNPTGNNPVSFRSGGTYVITMNRDLATFPESAFLQVLREVRGIDSTEIDVLSYVEDSDNNNIVATFQCLSTQSIQNADSSCAALVRDANTAGNSLNNRLNVIRSVEVDDDAEVDDDGGSNTALYGLFGLAILIPLCLLAVCLALKAKRRKADNQYMQDTATFSNVAASPQPINYPYPYHGAAQATIDANKPVAMAEPIVAIDAPPAYVA